MQETVTYHYRGMKQRGEFDGSPILADVYSETKDSKQMTFDECQKDARRRKLRAVFDRRSK